MSWLLWIVLQWIYRFMWHFQGKFCPDICPRVGLLGCSFFFSFLFRVAPVAYGSFLARGWIEAAAVGLCHSHSNTRFWVASVTYTASCSSARFLTHLARPGIKPISWQTLCQVLNPLSHNGNSQTLLFNCVFDISICVWYPFETY